VFNLVGALTYGLGGFLVVAVVARQLPVADAGAVLVAIAVFTVLARCAEMGASTGVVRAVSRARALGRLDEIRRVLVVATVPVGLVGSVLGIALWTQAERLGDLLGGADQADRVATALRPLAAALPAVAVGSVLVAASRGFSTMVPQLVVDRMARPLAQLVAVWLATGLTASVAVTAGAWVVPAALVGVPMAVVLAARLPATAAGSWVRIGREFWRFTAPRAGAQVLQVTILWFDTLLLSAVAGPATAGVYAVATRFVLVGTFAAEALQQVVGPRVAAQLALDDRAGASRLLDAAAGWQVLLVWPSFVLLGVFAPGVLAVFGASYADAAAVLGVLALGLLAAAPVGPSDSVLLMAGRSRANLGVTALAAAVNVVGNLVLVPTAGMVGAASAWATSLAVGAIVPAVLVRRMGIAPTGRPAVTAAAVGLVASGGGATAGLVVAGRSITGLVVAVVLGVPTLLAVARRQSGLELTSVVQGFRRSPMGVS
jgi:O-antigen/teichoic acid export membrane protein